MKLLILTLVINISLFAGSIEWKQNYRSAIDHAKQNNKLVFVFVTSKDCKFCKKLKETTLTNDDIVNSINKDYSSVIVMKNRDTFPEKLNAKATPMLYFLDKNENIIDYSLGYWDVLDFKFILKDVQKRIAKKDTK